jgi:hypothetical protein
VPMSCCCHLTLHAAKACATVAHKRNKEYDMTAMPCPAVPHHLACSELRLCPRDGHHAAPTTLLHLSHLTAPAAVPACI